MESAFSLALILSRTRLRSFFHFGHRRLSLSVLVEIADGLIGKVFGFFENLYGFFIGFAQDLVTAVVQTLIFGGQFLL